MSRTQISLSAAAGSVFALLFGVRQSQALFITPLNSGLGIAAVSLAFACAQLIWRWPSCRVSSAP
jgi:hypothetical protein